MRKAKVKSAVRGPRSKATADDRLGRLALAVAEVRAGERTSPRTTKLLKAGVAKMAQ